MKIMLISTALVFVFLLRLGQSCHDQASVLNEQRISLLQENESKEREFQEKRHLITRPPMKMDEAFHLLINVMRLIQDEGGAKMELSFINKGQKYSLEGLFMSSQYRQVKVLPIVLRINDLSPNTDIVSLLNDLYLLERQTDLKINEISSENNVLEAKGELYGI